MLPEIQITATKAAALITHLEKRRRRYWKALDTAIRVEAFRQVRQLKKEIRAGDPGGRRFAPLTFLARRAKTGRLRANKPLTRLAAGVRYKVESKNPVKVRFGFVGSQALRALAEKHQAGFRRQVSEKQRRFFANLGDSLSQRVKTRKVMFLTAGETEFKTPARPIVRPYWESNHRQAWQNIRKNWKQKAKGKRI